MKKYVFTIVSIVLVVGTVFSQSHQLPLIGEKAPTITVESTNGQITFPECYGENWKVLLSHPQDFTPVCTSELLEIANLQNDFEEIGANIAVISTDNIEQHKLWKAYLEEIDYKDRGTQVINFPLIDDSALKNSRMYGMIHDIENPRQNVRGVYIIDPDNIVRSVSFYPMNVGRNIDEILRLVVALQESHNGDVMTPANWQAGDDYLMPHFPYTVEQTDADPSLLDDYYSVANRMWFKKAISE